MKSYRRCTREKSVGPVVKNGNRELDTVENLEAGGITNLSGVRNIHVTPGRTACRGDLEQLATRSFYRGVKYERSHFVLDSEVPEKAVINEVDIALKGMQEDIWYFPTVLRRTVTAVVVSWVVGVLVAILSVISGYLMQFGAGFLE